MIHRRMGIGFVSCLESFFLLFLFLLFHFSLGTAYHLEFPSTSAFYKAGRSKAIITYRP